MRYLLITLLCMTQVLSCEIEKVTLRWTAQLCKQSCTQGLEKQLLKVPGVESVTINMEAGMAELQWKANAPFAFIPVQRAAQWIGLYLTDVRVKLRGTIVQDGVNFSIRSLGDNTTFLLVASVTQPNQSQIVNQYSYYNRNLSNELKEKLLDAKRRSLIAELEGPLFEPRRSPPNPLQLVVDQLSFVEKVDKKQTSPLHPTIHSPQPYYNTSQNSNTPVQTTPQSTVNQPNQYAPQTIIIPNNRSSSQPAQNTPHILTNPSNRSTSGK